MKRNLGPTTLVLLVFAMFVVSMASPSALAQQCSLAGAAGAYGFTGTGTLLLATGAVPIAAAGRLNLHGDGTLSGTEARSVGGDFANETLTGTWTVNANCRATVTAKVFVSGALVRTSVLSGVFDFRRELFDAARQECVLPRCLECNAAEFQRLNPTRYLFESDSGRLGIGAGEVVEKVRECFPERRHPQNGVNARRRSARIKNAISP